MRCCASDNVFPPSFAMLHVFLRKVRNKVTACHGGPAPGLCHFMVIQQMIEKLTDYIMKPTISQGTMIRNISALMHLVCCIISRQSISQSTLSISRKASHWFELVLSGSWYSVSVWSDILVSVGIEAITTLITWLHTTTYFEPDINSRDGVNTTLRSLYLLKTRSGLLVIKAVFIFWNLLFRSEDLPTSWWWGLVLSVIQQ